METAILEFNCKSQIVLGTQRHVTLHGPATILRIKTSCRPAGTAYDRSLKLGTEYVLNAQLLVFLISSLVFDRTYDQAETRIKWDSHFVRHHDHRYQTTATLQIFYPRIMFGFETSQNRHAVVALGQPHYDAVDMRWRTS